SAKADVQAPHVAREGVVGRVAIERLPASVGRIIVAEPLRGARPGNDHLARLPTHHAVDLARPAVPEALRIASASLRAQPSNRAHGDWRLEDAAQIVGHRGAVDHAASGARTVIDRVSFIAPCPSGSSAAPRIAARIDSRRADRLGARAVPGRSSGSGTPVLGRRERAPPMFCDEGAHGPGAAPQRASPLTGMGRTTLPVRGSKQRQRGGQWSFWQEKLAASSTLPPSYDAVFG